jgi:SPP1 family predicted phage head-tail adaptor
VAAAVLNIGRLNKRVSLANSGDPVADGDGGYTQAFAALTPPVVWAAIQPAAARDLERLAAGTVLATATHLVTMRHHAGVTTQTRITFGTRLFAVTGVVNPEERNIETIALCVEVVA